MLHWHLLDIEALWQAGITGAGVKVGHLDTGIDGTHPAFEGRVADFALADAEAGLLTNILPQDSGHHGTHTAGIICGGVIAGQAIGVAPAASLCSAMVIEGSRPLVRVLLGLDWMLDQKVQVLCVSLGIPGYNRVFEIILGRLRLRGTLAVFPVGNAGYGRSHSPANYPGVLAIGAVDQQGQVPPFSSSDRFNRPDDATKPNLVAPGTEISSAAPGGGLTDQSGTSMAAAHVAGVAALLFQGKPDASADEVEQALLKTCKPLTNNPQRCGCGLVNPAGALERLTVSSLPPKKPCWQSFKTLEVDARLRRQLKDAGPTTLIDAIVIVVDGARDPLQTSDDGGLGERVMQGVIQQTSNTPSSIQYVPRANAIALTAHAEFIEALLTHPDVKIASSATIDSLFF